ncbi:IclR family transcriptional regulator [Actinomyces glycerinitolerans]|uniref:Transcription regulator iclr n-terminal n=1 Tax=Actinomyces glycerinitolerans TaxID=1892869 RepID=A0A1M4S390_9ACTO|nr:IclR family transcriptional regulator [Actinomyces glycerinitolerans]SHE26675.1 transcription regulator iclr n-terminal [Actinomyces glycerinitolerans]
MPAPNPKPIRTGRKPVTIASVDKALAVVEHLLAVDAEGVSLSRLAVDTGINKSSLHHILATLRQRRWVEQDESGRYRLGPMTGRMATWWTSANQAASMLHPVLLAICERTHELVHLGRLYERDVVYLDKVEPDRPVRVWSRIGQSAPVATTAMGRAILGARQPSAAEVETWVSLVPEASAELHGRLTEEMQRVQSHGYAIEIGEDRPSLACVGVPLAVAGVPVLAISATMPVERADLPHLRQIADVIHECIAAADVEGISVPVTLAD